MWIHQVGIVNLNNSTNFIIFCWVPMMLYKKITNIFICLQIEFNAWGYVYMATLLWEYVKKLIYRKFWSILILCWNNRNFSHSNLLVLIKIYLIWKNNFTHRINIRAHEFHRKSNFFICQPVYVYSGIADAQKVRNYQIDNTRELLKIQNVHNEKND